MIYARVGGKCEGEMWSAKVCLLCKEIGDKFSCGNGVSYGNLWEEMAEYVFPDLTMANKCFVELSPVAKQFVLEQWNDWKF